MDIFNEDLDDSALMYMPVAQKRKASGESNKKKTKQTKLDIGQSSLQAPKSQDRDLNKFTHNQNLDKNLDESISSYFETPKKPNTCPLCLRVFESDSNYLTHMKQCAKKKQLTTQQLLSALKLQKEHMEQRRMLGLCSQIVPISKKTQPRKTEVDKQDQYNLALGLAMSNSLTATESNPTISAETPALLPGHVKKKSKIFKTSVLKQRTSEERQRIITEKAAVVLLDENEKICLEHINQHIPVQNVQLENLVNPVPQLWNLGENEVPPKRYVDEIRSLMVTEENNLEPVKTLPVEKEIYKLDLPAEDINEDWRKMINNRKLSDLVGKTKDGCTFYFHSLVLFARCPGVLEKDYEAIFQKFRMSTVQSFLEYVYCGDLGGLVGTEVRDLLDLAVSLNCENLIKILKSCAEQSEASDSVIPSILTRTLRGNSDKQPADTSNKEGDEGEVLFCEDEDLFEPNVMDVSQSSCSSTLKGEERDKSSSNESNAEKSYWSFIQHEKERERLEVARRLEEENTKTITREETAMIETSMRERGELQQISKEVEKELDLNDLEICEIQRRDSSDSATKGFSEELKKGGIRGSYECILSSSDSDTRASKIEETYRGVKSPQEIRPPSDLDYEIPCFDPYDNFNNLSPPEPSQSFITGDVSFGTATTDVQEEPREEDRKKTPQYCSTPLTNQKIPRIQSDKDKSKHRRRDLSSSRILRKSLGLNLRARNSGSNSTKKKRVRRKGSCNGDQSFAKILSNSILRDFSNSPLSNCSTPVRSKSFMEVTPVASRDEFGESVTPSPNYSNMGEALLKEHLSKYGLKRSLAKNKAKKILRHIYEELHPLLNTKTGKIVKILPSETPKGRKRTKARMTGNRKSSRGAKISQRKRNFPEERKARSDSNRQNSSKESDQMSQQSPYSLDGSFIYNSDGSEFGDLHEPLTQSLPNNAVDLPSAFSEFLEKNPEFHQKILLYEPVWLEELQSKLKETFKKHFKLSDLMDYLDQKCITFRSEAQKRNNQKRNEKKKQSPRKKKVLS